MTTSTTSPVSAEVIRRALQGFQVRADDQQIALIQRYMAILMRWNDKLNLTAIRDPLEILNRHFCESMFAGTAIPIDSGGRLADIGTGAGFPGIPLKILRPELELFLVESNIKKGTFLAEVLRDLELPGVGGRAGAAGLCVRESRRRVRTVLRMGRVGATVGAPTCAVGGRTGPRRNPEIGRVGMARADFGTAIVAEICAYGREKDAGVGVTTVFAANTYL